MPDEKEFELGRREALAARVTDESLNEAENTLKSVTEKSYFGPMSSRVPISDVTSLSQSTFGLFMFRKMSGSSL